MESLSIAHKPSYIEVCLLPRVPICYHFIVAYEEAQHSLIYVKSTYGYKAEENVLSKLGFWHILKGLIPFSFLSLGKPLKEEVWPNTRAASSEHNVAAADGVQCEERNMEQDVCAGKGICRLCESLAAAGLWLLGRELLQDRDVI